MQYDGSIRIDTNINPNSIPSYEINRESIERLREMTSKIEKTLATLINTESIKKSMEMLNTVMKDIFLDLSPTLEQYNFEEALKSIRYSFTEMADVIGLKNIETLRNIDFSRVFGEPFYRERYDEASQMAFDFVEEEVNVEANISQEELLEIFNEQIEDKIGWQEKLYNKSEDFKRKYFVFYKIFIGCLWFIFSQIAIYFAQLGIAYVFGNVVSEPKEDAPAIYYFEHRTEINIIGETDNYYFITYTDDDGNEVTGYSEKENIEIVPESNDDESMEKIE